MSDVWNKYIIFKNAYKIIKTAVELPLVFGSCKDLPILKFTDYNFQTNQISEVNILFWLALVQRDCPLLLIQEHRDRCNLRTVFQTVILMAFQNSPWLHVCHHRLNSSFIGRCSLWLSLVKLVHFLEPSLKIKLQTFGGDFDSQNLVRESSLSLSTTAAFDAYLCSIIQIIAFWRWPYVLFL